MTTTEYEQLVDDLAARATLLAENHVQFWMDLPPEVQEREKARRAVSLQGVPAL